MADNVILPGTGSSVASDDIGGHQYQRVKISIGDSGAATDLGPGQELMAASVPVVIASNQSSIPVAGVAADDAAASGNPVMIGGKYLATPDILLADGDVGSARITQRRALRVVNDKATVTEYDEMPADGDAFDLYPTLRKAHEGFEFSVLNNLDVAVTVYAYKMAYANSVIATQVVAAGENWYFGVGAKQSGLSNNYVQVDSLLHMPENGRIRIDPASAPSSGTLTITVHYV